MKRSEINRIIEDTINYLKGRDFPLPPFAFKTPPEWAALQEDERELAHNMLGWDVTDFGTGDFAHTGLTVFTFRNGNYHDRKRYPKPYCEKLLMVEDGQILPYHYHWYKMEDIINRGGGDLALTLYNCTPEDFADRDAAVRGIRGTFADTPVEVTMDGRTFTVPAGDRVIMKPGQSITLKPGQYHTWQGVPGTGKVMLFEVSTCNDDTSDNRFYEAGSRIPDIEEDEAIRHCIFKDYMEEEI